MVGKVWKKQAASAHMKVGRWELEREGNVRAEWKAQRMSVILNQRLAGCQACNIYRESEGREMGRKSKGREIS